MQISPARKAAFDVLHRVETEKAITSILLPIYEGKLEKRDAALCHELSLGVLRRRLFLDQLIAEFTGKPIAKFDTEVLTALRLGVFQLKFLDKVPAYSAINESVNLVKKARKRSASGLVNAVLRRTSKEEPKFTFYDSVERLALETSHPRWLLERWEVQLGEAETRRLAAANNLQPETYFRFTAKSRSQSEEFRKGLIEQFGESGITRDQAAEGCFVAPKVTEELMRLAASGLIYFQDAASQLVAHLVGLDDGESFLDVCASPGSKSTLVSAIHSEGSTAQVFGDLHLSRLRILRESFEKQGDRAKNVVQYDAEISLPFKEESFDSILVDAPCTGTGTIRRNPEIRYFLKPEDFSALPRKQLAILKNASKLLKKGGGLIYSTCSLEREENEDVVESFLDEASDFELKKIEGYERFQKDSGFLRTFPQRDEMDGFFVAMLARKA